MSKRTVLTRARTFRVSEELAKSLDAMAEEINAHRSALIRAAVREFINRYEAQPDNLKRLEL